MCALTSHSLLKFWLDVGGGCGHSSVLMAKPVVVLRVPCDDGILGGPVGTVAVPGGGGGLDYALVDLDVAKLPPW